MDLLKSIQEIALNTIKSLNFNEVFYGEVLTVEPKLTIKLADTTILYDDELLLTDSVIRREFTIVPHTHKYPDDFFKHNHGSPILGGDGLNVVVSGQAAFVPAGSQVQLKDGQKSFDLTATTDDLESLLNEGSTKDTVKVSVNGEDILLAKDEDGGEYDDEAKTPIMWAVINHGLKIGDKVLLLNCMDGQKYIILSKLYDGHSFRKE